VSVRFILCATEMTYCDERFSEEVTTQTTFRDVIPCSLVCMNRHFGQNYRLDIHGGLLWKWRQPDSLNACIYQTTRRHIPKYRPSCQPPIPSAFEIHQKQLNKDIQTGASFQLCELFLNATNLQAVSRVHRDKSHHMRI